MVSVPGSAFRMGDLNGDGDDDEKPIRWVKVEPFKMSRYEITFEQWDACIEAGGCTHVPKDEGWGRGSRPVINVSSNDITQQFIPWLNNATGKRFRLPSEAEWEYAARSGRTTNFFWGNNIGSEMANCEGCGSKWDNSRTAPVGSFGANHFGLYDMHGNVWEWTQDCWNKNYSDAPNTGITWTSGDCDRRVVRGGSWNSIPKGLRYSNRTSIIAGNRYSDTGFRLVQN